jgi:hypothetical protein
MEDYSVAETLPKPPASTGQCVFCQQRFGKASMTNHLKRCAARTEQRPSRRSGRGKSGAFHVVVEGAYNPEYWLHLEVPCDLTLDHLDALLRRQWLECCGHLSQFTIGTTRYVSPELLSTPNVFGGPWDEKRTDGRVDRILSPGLKIDYEYDFGSTTPLKLRVVAQLTEASAREIRILAQNDEPAIPCVACGNPAKQVCTECGWSGDGWVCDTCADQHECGDEMMLPVVNSPRVGACAYGV